MYKKRIKNNHGFTLMEIIVAAGLFFILGTITVMFFTQCTSSWRRLTIESDLRSTGLNDILYMTRELGKAANIVIPAAPNNNSITFNLPCDNASATAGAPCNGSSTCAAADCPLVDANRNTQWNTNNAIQYLISNNQLQRLVNGVISHVISPNVTGVTFEDNSITPLSLNNDEIKITLTLTQPMLAGNTLNVTLTGIVKLRNQ